jgi:hypothetical protein
MAKCLREVAELPDPIGDIVKTWTRPNGLIIGQLRVPLGVVGVIYESRPEVTSDAAGLCLKSGNAIILRGGSDAINSNLAIGKILSEAAERAGVHEGAIQVVPTTERSAAVELMMMRDYVDVLIPRGGAELIRTVVDEVNGKLPVVAGTGSMSTQETIALTKDAKDFGADAALVVTPFYFKLSNREIHRHYKAVAEAVDIPMVLYNVPGRTAVNMLPSTVARLAEIKNIIGVKEATGDMKQVSELIRLCGDRMTVLSGDDFTTLTLLALGGLYFALFRHRWWLAAPALLALALPVPNTVAVRGRLDIPRLAEPVLVLPPDLNLQDQLGHVLPEG